MLHAAFGPQRARGQKNAGFRFAASQVLIKRNTPPEGIK